MIDSKRERLRTLDRCFRTPVAKYYLKDLLDVCNSSLLFFGKTVSESTIRHDIGFIKDIFGKEIFEDCMVGHEKYYRYKDTSFSIMPELYNEDPNHAKIFKEIQEMLNEYEDIPEYKWISVLVQQLSCGIHSVQTDVIGFDNIIYSGLEHFSSVLEAIITHTTLKIEYKPYRQQASEHIVFPYYLKQYNNRWFLIGRTKGYVKYTNFALDRIQSIKNDQTEFEPSGTNFEEYFSQTLGASLNDKNEVQDIKIKISRFRYPYIRTKKIHASQKELLSLRGEDYHIVSLKLRINNELVAKILSLGKDVEVLEPKELRDKITEQIIELNNKYCNIAKNLQP